MDRFPDRRELDVEGCAFAGRRADINLSGMFLDDAVTHGKPEAGAAAVGLGGKERFKDGVLRVWGYAGPGTPNFDFAAAVMRRGSDFQHSAAGHGIARVQ